MHPIIPLTHHMHECRSVPSRTALHFSHSAIQSFIRHTLQLSLQQSSYVPVKLDDAGDICDGASIIERVGEVFENLCPADILVEAECL